MSPNAPPSPGARVFGYDVATALWQGKRPYQEDTLLADFHGGLDRGFAVLADGMGGHAAGDLASRLVVIDAVSHLKFLMHDGPGLEKNLQAELELAIQTANDVLSQRAKGDQRLHGMGTTLLATVLFEDRLYWASVGDSPLYLWREGQLRQLNEDHSMAPVIDQMAKAGKISEAEAARHPDRNALTSVLMGRPVSQMDVPETATVLDPGDVLIQASDGLQFLEETQIAQVVEDAGPGASSRAIVDALMAALCALDDPLQDNTAILVLRLVEAEGTGSGGARTAGAGAVSGLAPTGAVSGLAPTGAVSERAPTARGSEATAPQADLAATGEGHSANSMPVAAPGGRAWIRPVAVIGGVALALVLILGLLRSAEASADLSRADDPASEVGTGAPLALGSAPAPYAPQTMQGDSTLPTAPVASRVPRPSQAAPKAVTRAGEGAESGGKGETPSGDLSISARSGDAPGPSLPATLSTDPGEIAVVDWRRPGGEGSAHAAPPEPHSEGLATPIPSNPGPGQIRNGGAAPAPRAPAAEPLGPAPTSAPPDSEAEADARHLLGPRQNAGARPAPLGPRTASDQPQARQICSQGGPPRGFGRSHCISVVLRPDAERGPSRPPGRADTAPKYRSRDG